MILRKIIFASLVVLVFFAGCDKKADDAKKEILIMCDSSFVVPATQLGNEFKEKTGIDPLINLVSSTDFIPIVKIAKENDTLITGDILITHDPFLELVTDAEALAANAEVGFVKKNTNEPQQSKRVHVIGLNYSENSIAIMQFVEFARDRGTDIFAEHGYVK